MSVVADPTPAPTRLGRREWTNLAGMGGFIALLHVFGWGSLLFLVVPHNYDLGTSGVFGVGLGVTAYTLGMRHAFDADHIAAIDNTTRKLMLDGKRPLSVGFWFSLGHSSVVFLLCFLLGLGVRALAGQVADDSSTLHLVTGLIGTLVSGVFLMIIGIINLVVLLGVIRVFRQMRTGRFDEAELERKLNQRGFANRLLGGLTAAIRKPWQMYPLGLLFGLGFDTATEVSLLVLAGGAAAFNLPWYAILTLPVLFAAGMCLLDSIDGCFMNFAYGWAFAQPVRKVFYNITVTGLSVAVALGIGLVELLGLLGEELGVESGPLAWAAALDLNYVGYAIVGLFIPVWLIALAVWRFGRIEQRWSTPVAAEEAAPSR
ncbi:Nickel transporter NicT [Goodfellowiella coeruleoviolacea]|uniref:Nickel/cobalt efflux system n=1 Tax=Goodfellowiella coeruleoviolacea TaxID=334858 RepID=A0AAE3KH99_9PSEU|nr:HoxN/HupN/NixA family nickel/cobalt transporter [Goodfellowiella coeruleoviolacea]MCP2168081.1 high-affinity nickel-transport protein [Goodfellowiella coeruleoviolacea]